MTERIISFPVIQATSLDPFTLNDKRNLGYHYFEFTDAGWIFHWISEETEIGWLQDKIKKGSIYIFNDKSLKERQ